MIEVVPYRQDWVQQFQEEKKRLAPIFKGFPFDLYHIGSTAITGASAKPVIDMLGVTADNSRIDALNDKLIALGYQPMGEFGMKQRRFFRKPGFSLHIFEDSDPEVCRHLRFVAYMNAHPEAVQHYSELKKQLAASYPDDITSYILGKEGWIKQIDRLAAEEKIVPASYPPIGPRSSQWSLERIIKALHVNLHLHMIYFSKYHPNMRLFFQPDVTVILTEHLDDLFNYVLSAKFKGEDAEERIDAVIKLYTDRKLPFSWWVSQSEDTPASLGSLLEKKGLRAVEQECGMYLELTGYQPVAQKDKIRRVEHRKRLQEFASIIDVVAGSQNIFEKFYKKIPPILYQEGAPLELYLLYHDAKPVCTGIALFHAHVVGIYYIATLPEQRRRGFGTAMMHHLLARAKAKGYHMATLEASEQGEKLYAKLGFKECCRFVEYKNNPLLPQ